jgi:uncharacterized protein (TIGR03083 family)
MKKDELLTCLHDDAARLAEAARLGLDADVPTCPGWVVADLAAHTGAVLRAQTVVVRERLQAAPEFDPAVLDSLPGLLKWMMGRMEGKARADAFPRGVIGWFVKAAVEMEQALRAADPDEPVWSWSRDARVEHYLRMMPIEVAVHRFDAQAAQGTMEPIDRALAEHGISQTFEVMAPFRRGVKSAPAGEGERFGFVQSDGPGRWNVRFDGDSIGVMREEATADVTVVGTASDLFLFLWQRVPADALEVRGDEGAVGRYFELVPPV